MMPGREEVTRSCRRQSGTAAVVCEQLLTLREAADLLGIHWKTLEIQARRGEIVATKSVRDGGFEPVCSNTHRRDFDRPH